MSAQDLTHVLIRVGLLIVLVVLCVRVFSPFTSLMVWAVTLAVSLYPLHRKVARALGGRQGRAATALVLSGLLVIGGPTVMLGSSFAGKLNEAYTAFESGSIAIKKPEPEVAEWPLVGKRVFEAWTNVAENLPAVIEKNEAKLKNLSKKALSIAADTAGAVLLFLASLIIAGIIMAYGQSGSAAMGRVFSAVTGDVKGPKLQRLATATVRSVATGVIGVAFIQALLLGLGFLMAGIPVAGPLSLIVLLLGICQLPALLVTLPVIGYVWWSGDSSTAMSVVYTVYLLVAGAADGFLKPILLGRGVDAPMPVVLLGALGGMATSGLIGLFEGAVVLSVGYVVFMEWVDASQGVGSAGDSPPDSAPADPSKTG